jgi:hypothetical protein
MGWGAIKKVGVSLILFFTASVDTDGVVIQELGFSFHPLPVNWGIKQYFDFHTVHLYAACKSLLNSCPRISAAQWKERRIWPCYS